MTEARSASSARLKGGVLFDLVESFFDAYDETHFLTTPLAFTEATLSTGVVLACVPSFKSLIEDTGA